MDATAFRSALNGWDVGDGALYRRLAHSIEARIDEGVFRRGIVLPAERIAAAELAVSRGTVVRAYEHLVGKSLLTRRQGRGTTVAGVAPELAEVSYIGTQLWSESGSLIDLRRDSVMPLPQAMQAANQIGVVPRACEDELEPLGMWDLRQTVADLYSSEGLTTSPHQIMVTSGSQQAASIVIGTLLRPGDVVLGEHNTWPGLINAVRLHGCSFRPVAMDDGGMIVEDLHRLIHKFRPSLVAINPQFQNPTGTCVTDSRAAAIAGLCRAEGVPIFESRVNARLGFDHRYRPPVAQHDVALEAFIGDSLSMVAWGGLRLGWLRADPAFVQAAKATKHASDGATPILSQLIACELLHDLDALVSARIAAQRASADAAIDATRAELPEWRFVAPRGGTVFSAELPTGVSAQQFCEHAAKYGVLLASCKDFSLCGGARHVRLPFVKPPETIREGLRRAGEAWRTFDPANRITAA